MISNKIEKNVSEKEVEVSRSDDFVKRYVRLLSQFTDAPEEFQEAAALFLLSTGVGRKWVFRSMPEATIFGKSSEPSGKPLNLWFTLIGRSRVTRKSTGVLKHVEEAAKDAFGEDRFLSRAFTPEFLIKEMQTKTIQTAAGPETPCVWIRDEIAGFFAQLKKKDSYLTNTDALLSTIYDGSSYSSGTIGREKEAVPSPYLTCFLASTDYLPTLFDSLQLRLGFLNRFIFVIGDRKERKALRTDPITEDEKKEAKEIENFLKALAKRSILTMLEMSTEAKRIYDSFEEDIERRISSENLDSREGYIGQLPNLVARLMCLYRISRMTLDELNECTSVVCIDREDVEKAIQYAQRTWDWFEEVAEIMFGSHGKETMQEHVVDSAVVKLLEDGKQKHIKEIIDGLNKVNINVCQATVYNRLRRLKQDRKVASSRFGFYEIIRENAGNARGE